MKNASCKLSKIDLYRIKVHITVYRYISICMYIILHIYTIRYLLTRTFFFSGFLKLYYLNCVYIWDECTLLGVLKYFITLVINFDNKFTSDYIQRITAKFYNNNLSKCINPIKIRANGYSIVVQSHRKQNKNVISLLCQ